MSEIVNLENISEIIYVIRGQKVIFDFDLALLYEVKTKVLKQQVRRNVNRFPQDFMFPLDKKEWKELVTNCDQLKKYRNSSSPPFAFTEQGVSMLSSVLRSEKAVEINISIMRAFVELRKFMVNNQEILKMIIDLETDVKTKFFEQDKQINLIFETIKGMVKEDTDENGRKIGFDTDF